MLGQMLSAIMMKANCQLAMSRIPPWPPRPPTNKSKGSNGSDSDTHNRAIATILLVQLQGYIVLLLIHQNIIFAYCFRNVLQLLLYWIMTHLPTFHCFLLCEVSLVQTVQRDFMSREVRRRNGGFQDVMPVNYFGKHLRLR